MIEIGKVIYKALEDNGIISYPIVAPENSTLPLVIYERAFTAESTKDGRTWNTNSVDIYVLSEDYKESITLSKQIEDIVTSIQGTLLGSYIVKSKLIAGVEMYESGVYIQKLTFEIKTAV